MKGYEAALFDMDGTLIYSKGVIVRCLNETLVHFGYEPFTKREMHGLIGRPLSEVLAHRTEDTDPLVEFYRGHYLATYRDGTFFYDGVESVMEMLKKGKKKIGIVTLKSTYVAREVVRGMGISDLVDAVEGDDDVSELKPSPDQIIRVCGKLDVEPEGSVVVGDTAMDMVAGKKAGCTTIGVLWGAMSMDQLSEAGADHFARSPEELGNLLRRL